MYRKTALLVLEFSHGCTGAREKCTRCERKKSQSAKNIDDFYLF